MSTIDDQDMEGIFKAAMRCRVCFGSGVLQPSSIDIAQPRWIGPNYAVANTRVLILLTNPGAGSNRSDSNDLIFANLLHKYLVNATTILDVFAHQLSDMMNWNKFTAFYIDGFGLNISEIALMNIAWCGARDDQHPKWMLDQCYTRHTEKLLKLLKPDLVIIGGGAAAQYDEKIRHAIPSIETIRVLHFAHRKGVGAQALDIDRVRKYLEMTRHSQREPKPANLVL